MDSTDKTGPSTEALIAQACSPDTDIRQRAIDALVAQGPDAVLQLASALGEDIPEQVRQEASRALLQVVPQLVERENQRRQREAAEAASIQRKRVLGGWLGTFVLKFFAGRPLHEAAVRCWDAWANYLRRKRSTLPEPETRELTAALLVRLTRTSLVLLLLAAAPSILVLSQTLLLSAQNEKLDRQNALMALEQSARFRTLVASKSYAVNPFTKLPPLNHSDMAQLLLFAETEPGLVVRSLIPLLVDEDLGTSLNALAVLISLRHSSNEETQEATLDTLGERYAWVASLPDYYPVLLQANSPESLRHAREYSAQRYDWLSRGKHHIARLDEQGLAAIPAFAMLSQDPLPEIRRAAADGMGRLLAQYPSAQARSLLENLSKDADAGVQQAARKALENLSPPPPSMEKTP